MSKGPFYRQSLKRPRGKRRSKRFNGRAVRSHRMFPRFLTRSLRADTGVSGIGIAARALGAFTLVLFFMVVVVAAGAGASAVYGWTRVTEDLPDYRDVEALQFETTQIYDRDGRLLHEVSDPLTGWRTAISYEEVIENVEQHSDQEGAPQEAYIFDAMVAAEDSTFWTNPGIDVMAISRSLVTNITGGATSGASTITQQLVRALFPEQIGYERSYTRKMREAVVAWQLNREHEKEVILEMYLNNVYFGNRAYGVDAAAQSYFNKYAWNLSLAEAAMLAGLPQAPSLYDPTQNFELAKIRQGYVLDRMVELEMISELDAEEAYEVPLNPQQREGRHDLAPHFVNYVRYVLEQEYGAETLFRGGLEVHTTLDYELQLKAEEIVRNGVADLEPWDVDNGAMISMIPWSGEILTMVGSADYYRDSIDGQVNVTTRERQPGSSIKPFTYLAALENGWHPGTMLFDYGKVWDTPDADQEEYSPRNATGQFYGAISMREALGNSLNIPAVQALEHVGVEEVINLAQDLGIRTGLWRGMSHYGLSITLGGGEVSLLEHTNSFGTIANNGAYVPHTPFKKITDADGEVLFDLERETALERGEQVVDAEHAYQISDMLSDNDARSMIFGTNSPLVIPELGDRPLAAKTGTTDDARDGWTMGYSTDVVTGVWVGNTDNRPTQSLNGVQGAAPIWHDFMQLVHTDPNFSELLLGPDGEERDDEFPVPDGIVRDEICSTTGKLPTSDWAESREEVLVEDELPELECNEIDDYEEDELVAALEDAVSNPSFTERGILSLHEYAVMVGVPSPFFQEEEEEDEEVEDGGGTQTDTGDPPVTNAPVDEGVTAPPDDGNGNNQTPVNGGEGAPPTNGQGQQQPEGGGDEQSTGQGVEDGGGDQLEPPADDGGDPGG
ncbi:MAG: transglycosylase domain-containing protein [Thermomicrobiaceae bacterium]